MNSAHLKIRFFASCAEAAGRKEMRITVEGGTTLSMLKDRLASLHPRLKPLIPGIAFAVNGDVKKQDTVLRDGDEVSLLPPVSGGKGRGEGQIEKGVLWQSSRKKKLYQQTSSGR